MPRGPGARVPARPDGTEGEDARSGGVTQTKKCAARIVRTLVIDPRTRIGDTASARREPPQKRAALAGADGISPRLRALVQRTDPLAGG